MKSILKLYLIAALAAAIAACGGAAGNKASTGSNPTPTPFVGPPTKEALLALEKSAYEAWKAKSPSFWGTFLADNFVGFGTAGRIDKAGAMKEYGETPCDVKSFTLSDEQMTPLGDDAAYLTYKTTIDATCGGKPVPKNSMATGLYLRVGSGWKGAFHAETPIIDPKAPPAPAKTEPAKTADDAKPADPFMASEQIAWNAWKNKDADALNNYAAKSLTFISPAGQRLDRAAAMKSWTDDNKCEINSISLTDGSRVSLGKDLILFTYKAAVDGKCDGQSVPTVWNATIYTKEDETWKATFLHEVPAM